MCDINPMRDEQNWSVYIGKKVNSLSIALVQQHVFRFIVSKVKLSCSCHLKAKAIQSRVLRQNNCPSFGKKSTLSRIVPYAPREQAWLVSIYMVCIKHVVYFIYQGNTRISRTEFVYADDKRPQMFAYICASSLKWCIWNIPVLFHINYYD